MEQHDCYDGFWGHNGVVEALVLILDEVALSGSGGARHMSRATYHTLCALQMEIQRALGANPDLRLPQPYIGGVSPLPDADEADLRAAAQAVMAELMKDQYDSAANAHNERTLNWINTSGTVQQIPNDAFQALNGGSNAPLIVRPQGLLFKVRNSLDS